MRKIVIIEGSNYCGKTTITNMIKQLLPGAIVLEFHDYYHQHILNESPQIDDLYSKSHYMDLDATILEKAESYINFRNEFVIKAITELKYNHFIIERSFLTQMVYRDLLFGIKKHSNIESFMGELSPIDVKLVFVTVSNDILYNRITYDNPKLIERSSPNTPFHLKDINVLMEKNELYNFYFDRIDRIKKIKIDTTNISDTDKMTLIKRFINNKNSD